MTMRVVSQRTLLAEFKAITGLTPEPTPEYEAQLEAFVRCLKWKLAETEGS